MVAQDSLTLPFEVGVYTQGKVGSKSVVAAIRRMFSEYADLRVWDYRRSSPSGVAEHRAVQGNRPRLLSDDDEISQFLVDHPTRALRMTTIVREPIAINLSSFFYNFGPRNPDINLNDLTDEEIIHRLLAGESFSSPSFHLDWFDIEVKAMTGVDIYSQASFPQTPGYEAYSGDKDGRHTDLLAFRLEDIDIVGSTALATFYDTPPVVIGRVNAADEQAYAGRYAAFKRDACFPVDWIEWQLNSRYARFFYSHDERMAFAQRWTGMDMRAINIA